MAMYRKALTVFTLPFRAVWLLIQIACFLLVSAACILVAAFVGYWVVLTLSYAFLPLETTENIWQWASDLYEQSVWFKAATIVAYLLLILPILRFWPGEDSIVEAARKREMMRLNEGVIAARRQDEALAKLRGR
ncbi:hypothetical protein FLX27_23270 [Agrobacterium tumefaciens]|nr:MULTISPECIES: hypothetical protein [Rhizobium/Agrobacterium group]KNY31263.1 hypothetical protein AKG12_25605 [Agrobacterium sp. SUL3]TQN59209.1 hypothetical protein FLX27_23270 [Agrobacterium tumefaciens]